MTQQWMSFSYKSDAAFGDRIFVNMPWRAAAMRSNRLTMWVAPVLGREDEPGAWRFHAKSGANPVSESQAGELLAGVFTMLAAHGFSPEKLTFSAFAALAQRPQQHIPATQREAAKRHIVKQRSLQAPEQEFGRD